MIVLIGKLLFYLIIYCDCPTIKFYITKLSIDMYFINKVYLTPLFYFLFTSGGIKLHFEQKKRCILWKYSSSIVFAQNCIGVFFVNFFSGDYQWT